MDKISQEDIDAQYDKWAKHPMDIFFSEEDIQNINKKRKDAVEAFLEIINTLKEKEIK